MVIILECLVERGEESGYIFLYRFINTQRKKVLTDTTSINTIQNMIECLAKSDKGMITGRLVDNGRQAAMDINQLSEQLSKIEHTIALVDIVLDLIQTRLDSNNISERVSDDMSQELAPRTSLADIECPIQTHTLIMIIVTSKYLEILDCHVIEDDIVSWTIQ